MSFGHTVLIGASLLTLILTTGYFYRRYTSIIAQSPLAKTNDFWLTYFGLVPPPKKNEKFDKLSQFLIHEGQEIRQSPISVAWSIMGTPLVLVNSLQGIKDVLIDGQAKKKGQKDTNVQRGNLIRFIHCLVFGGKSINNTIGDEWQWRRHVLLPSFQPRQLVVSLQPYVAQRTYTLLDVFQHAAEQGEAIEVDELFQDLTMDVINYCIYGISDLNYDIVGGRKSLKKHHYRLGLGFQSVEAWLPFGINKTSWAQRAFKPSREILQNFIRDSLDRSLEAAKGQANKTAFHSVAAAAMASGRYHPDRVDLVNDMLSLTFAGYDTTAHTLAFCFSELARHPDVQERIFAEVRQVLGPPPVDPSTITAEKLSRMSYVTAVYRETMRKYPAVVFIPVHVNHDTLVDGVVIPGGAEIWCNLRGLQMNPSIFPNPDKFDPSRWIKPDQNTVDYGFDRMVTDKSTPTRVTCENQYAFPDLSFTIGKHSCLGKNIAILELRTVIACTVNSFTLRLKPGCIIDTKIVLTTKPRYGVWVHFDKRTE